MGKTPSVEFLAAWTAGNKAAVRDQGIAISRVFPHDPSSVAVGQLALAADGPCVVELFDADTGETLYRSASTTSDEAQLEACLTSFIDRVPS